VLITTKGDESPDSSRMGVIGALVIFFHLRSLRINFTLLDRPSSALRLWDVVEYSEVADSVHARTWSNEKTVDMDGRCYSLDDPYYRLGPVHTCLYVRVRKTGHWDLFLGPLEWARAETGGTDQWVLQRRGFPGVTRVYPPPCPWDTHYQFSIKTLLSNENWTELN